MDSLAKKLHLSDPRDWYNVTASTLREHGASLLLHKYNGSPSTLLSAVYPEYPWDVSNFSCVPHGYWNNVKRHTDFMNEKQWSDVTTSSLVQSGASGLRSKYESLSHMMISLVPSYKEMCREFVHEVMRDLKLSKVEEVITVPTEYLKSRAPLLMRQHDHSITKCKNGVENLFFSLGND